MANVGVSNLHYAILSKDDETGVEYSAPKKIAGTIRIEVNPASTSATLYADNGAYDTDSTLGEITVTLELAELDLETQAALLGHTINNGVMTSNNADTAPYVALAFEALKSNGAKRYVKILKGKFKEMQDSLQTKDNSINFQTPTIEGSFLVRKYDGNWKYTADTDAANFDEAAAASWYTSIEKAAE